MKSFEEYLGEAIEVDHGAYLRSHGKRASGKGNWMIGIGRSHIDFNKHKEGEHYVQHNGSLSDAIKKAKDVAKVKGHMSVHPLP